MFDHDDLVGRVELLIVKGVAHRYLHHLAILEQIRGPNIDLPVFLVFDLFLLLLDIGVHYFKGVIFIITEGQDVLILIVFVLILSLG